MTAKQFSRRIQRHWRTQAAAAEALGVTKGAVAHWEHGRRPVPGVIVKLLACIEAAMNHVAEKST